jgi:hypothetical protein
MQGPKQNKLPQMPEERIHEEGKGDWMQQKVNILG